MFSVVIPVYNHARYVRQAIWSALRSPLVEEILVVDDGSSDDSAQIVARMAAEHATRICDLTPASGGNRGAHQRLNDLVDRAQCEWVAVLNSDDAFVSGRFESIVRDPEFAGADFVFGNLLFMDQRGALIGAKRGPLDTWKPFRPSSELMKLLADRRFEDLMRRQNYIVTTSNMIFRKSFHARLGGFGDFRYVHDWDFALRAMAAGRTAYVQRFLTAYRIHAGNTIQESESKAMLETRAMLQANAISASTHQSNR
jgi:glycosyltransferase involved in cell wall biosynthesis